MKLNLEQRKYYHGIFVEAARLLAEYKETYSCLAVAVAEHPELPVAEAQALYTHSPAVQLYKDLLTPRNYERSRYDPAQFNDYVSEGKGTLWVWDFEGEAVKKLPSALGHRVMALLSAAEYVRRAPLGEELF